jgi:hypothetical protein
MGQRELTRLMETSTWMRRLQKSLSQNGLFSASVSSKVWAEELDFWLCRSRSGDLAEGKQVASNTDLSLKHIAFSLLRLNFKIASLRVLWSSH